jgi:hypothetical protein
MANTDPTMDAHSWQARCFRGANTTTRKRNTLQCGRSFPGSTDYYSPSQPFMINCTVEDTVALLDRLKREGVKIDPKRMDESYSRFAWIYD